MSKQKEQVQFPQLIDMRKEGMFSKDGKTLFLDGVGRQGTALLKEFVTILRDSRAEMELFAASVSESGSKHEVEKALGWLPFGKPRVFTNPEEALEAMYTKEAGNLHTFIHFVSYDVGSEGVKNTVFSYTKGFPTLNHIAVIVRPSNPIDRRSYERTAGVHPPEKLPMPTIVIDEEKCEKLDKSSQGHGAISTKTAFLHGLAAIIAGPRLFPDVNRYSYRQVLEALTEDHKQIGIAIGTSEEPLIPVFRGLRHDLSQNKLADAVEAAIAASFTDNANITPFERSGDASSFDVIAVQAPLHFQHPYWRDPTFLPTLDETMRKDAEEKKITVPSEIAYVYSYSSLLARKDNTAAAFVAVRFFPVTTK